jgi:hypothetical protein
MPHPVSGPDDSCHDLARVSVRCASIFGKSKLTTEKLILLSFGHDIELLPNDKLQIWDLLWFFWSTSSNQADFRQLHQIGKLPELLK